ncbi:helix-turn-helix transcriptional regulator [Streptomyces sp. NPDC002156]
MNPQGRRPIHLTGVCARLVREPHEIRPSDDVVLFYGDCMGQSVRRFSAETEGGLPPAVVLAPRLDWDDVSLALHHGAVGYLLENQYVFLLAEALLCASRGASILDPVVAAEQVRVACRARGDAETDRAEPKVPHGRPGAVSPDRLPRLSPRERQVMDLLVAGLGVREVAQEMFLTDKTVRNYLSRIYSKLGVRRQSEAVLHWVGQPAATGPRGR